MSRRKGKRPAEPLGEESGPGERLQKVLAAAGVGSRRECEELITTGRVEVDGETVTQLGTRVNPVVQEIRVDGTALPRPRRLYFALNKPPGVVCTNYDPSGRIRAVDLVRSNERLFTVGRLDRTSEGLILITNDGELANQLTHPRYGVEKRYLARVAGSPSPALLAKLEKGIYIAEGIAKVSDVRVRKRVPKFTDLEIGLREGKNREIRRILARIGHKVVRLKRIAIGPLKLAELPVGSSRPLTREEVQKLYEVSQPGRKSKQPRRDSKRPTRTGGRPDQPASRRPEKPASPAAPEFEPDEIEVLESMSDRPRGTILSFDEPSTPEETRPGKRKGRRP